MTPEIPTPLTRVSPQVSLGSSSLSSTDVFLLLAPSGCWMWRGKNSTSKEVQGAQDLARALQATPVLLDEGEEEGVMEVKSYRIVQNVLSSVCFKSQMNSGKCWGVEGTTVTLPC